MRVLLVVYDNDSFIHEFPLALGYIAAVLRKNGIDVEIYNQDLHHYPDQHLTQYLDHNKFDVIGYSTIGGYYQYRKLLSVAEAINNSKNRPYFVIGGHGPAPDPEFFLKKTQADAVVIGEGEETVIELLAAIKNQEHLSAVQGIAFRIDDKVTVTQRRPLTEDIDSIPWPAYDLFPMEYYRLIRHPNTSSSDFVMSMLSGRGCSFSCSFCYRLDPGMRTRSSEAIIEEISYLKAEYGITYITFVDDLLMTSPQRTIELCQKMIKGNLNIKWNCNGRLNYAKKDVLKIMKEAGCVFVNYGIEAMDDQVLKNMNKALTTKQIVDGVTETLNLGISPGLNIIFGNIGDTKEVLEKDVEFLLKYDDQAQLRTIRPVTPYPGTALYNEAIERGLVKDIEDFYENKHLNSDLLAVNFTNMSDEEFHKSLLQANTKIIENYSAKTKKHLIDTAKDLYLNNNTSFRGFRQT